MTLTHPVQDGLVELVAERRDDDIAIVSMSGEIDLQLRKELRSVLHAAVAGSAGVLIDLSACSFMDSTGLDALLIAERAASTRRVGFAVACPPDGQPRRLMELAIPRALALHDDRASGLRGLLAASAAAPPAAS